jgi:YD repeat-containing protein
MNPRRTSAACLLLLFFVGAAYCDGQVPAKVETAYVGVHLRDYACSIGPDPEPVAQSELAVYLADHVCNPSGVHVTGFLEFSHEGDSTPGGKHCGYSTTFGRAYMYKLWTWGCPGYGPGPYLSGGVSAVPVVNTTCPPYSAPHPTEQSLCNCVKGYAPGPFVDGTQRCVPIVFVDDAPDQPLRCDADVSVGNPIYPLQGTKREVVDLGLKVSRLTVGLTYDSTPGLAMTSPKPDTPDYGVPAFGPFWSSSIHRRATVVPGIGARVALGDGRSLTFRQSGSRFDATGTTRYRFAAEGTGYLLLDPDQLRLDRFDATGRLLEVAFAQGGRIVFHYSDAATPPEVAPAPGYLLAALDGFGRGVNLSYELPQGGRADRDGRVRQLLDPSGRAINFGYGANGMLSDLTWQDGHVRRFVFADARFPWALTAIVDERQQVTSSFGYDAAGRAMLTERAGGANRHVVQYFDPPAVTITDTFDPESDGVIRRRSRSVPARVDVIRADSSVDSMAGAEVKGQPLLAARTQPAGAGCNASTRTAVHDAQGNLVSSDDWNGNRSCFLPSSERGLEMRRVEGLPGGMACTGVLQAGAALPEDAVAVSTDWHPVWSLPTRRAEPGRLTQWVYHGQPDPFNGGLPASCAPGAALLPDGQPMALLCSQVEQATLDPTGTLGMAAAVDTQVAPRVRRWTYNDHGQVSSSRGPRTDVDDTVLHAYHPVTQFSGTGSDAAGHWAGDLAQIDNALGHRYLYHLYDLRGLPLSEVDPNGVVTARRWDARGRLVELSVAGETMTFVQSPLGPVERVIEADGTSGVEFIRNAAHQLVEVRDHLGNRIEYTLDERGNPRIESVKDANHALWRRLSRHYDALGRVYRVEGQP